MSNDPTASSSSSASGNGHDANVTIALSPIPHNPPTRSALFSAGDAADAPIDRIRELEAQLAEARQAIASHSTVAPSLPSPQPSSIINQQLVSVDMLSGLFENMALTMGKVLDSKLAPLINNQRANDASNTTSSVPRMVMVNRNQAVLLHLPLLLWRSPVSALHQRKSLT